jgi:hypothetical protein
MVKLAPLSLNLTKLVFKEFKEERKGAKPVFIVCTFSVYKKKVDFF